MNRHGDVRIIEIIEQRILSHTIPKTEYHPPGWLPNPIVSLCLTLNPDAWTKITIEKGYKLINDTRYLNKGLLGTYEELNLDSPSAFFTKKYRVFCSQYYIMKGQLEVTLKFDYRTKTGKVTVRDFEVAGLCSISHDMDNLLYSLDRVIPQSATRRKQSYEYQKASS